MKDFMFIHKQTTSFIILLLSLLRLIQGIYLALLLCLIIYFRFGHSRIGDIFHVKKYLHILYMTEMSKLILIDKDEF